MLQSTFTIGDIIVVVGFLISVITIFVRFARFQTQMEARMDNAERRLDIKDELDKRQDHDILAFRDDTRDSLHAITTLVTRMDERQITLFKTLEKMTK